MDGGYCDTCGRAPLAPALVTGPPTSLGPSPMSGSSSPSGDGSGAGGRYYARPRLRPTSARTGSSGRRAPAGKGSAEVVSRRPGGTRLGLGLVDVPAVPRGDPLAAVMPVAQVPEDTRFCSKCSSPQPPAGTAGGILPPVPDPVLLHASARTG